MKKMTTACAIALGFAWAAAPAMAQTTPQSKADDKAQKIEQKGEQKADKLEQKADETRAKADQKADKARAEGTTDKAGESESKMEQAWDKTKAKTKELGHQAKDAVTPDKTKGEAAVDVRGAQQALRDKGFDPGPIDGVMGPRTTAALRDFQSKEGLMATGQLDADTRARLAGLSGADTGTTRSGSSAPAASPSSGTGTTSSDTMKSDTMKKGAPQK
jgi:peptidoglycan hydrolase-like protein with peptidoglycan-binding domain